MSKKSEVRGYCLYCKNIIYYSQAHTEDKDGKIYHPDCYIQLNTFTDDFGTYSTNEFGELLDE